MKSYAVRVTVRIVFFVFMASVFLAVHLVFGEEHPGGEGVQIHTSTVEGYGFVYTLYHFPERKTWHLMVAITDPEGANTEKGKVGFLVVGPNGSKQKTMAMGMKGAYGADLDFVSKGAYLVKVKAIIGDKKLFHRFKYEMR